MTEKPRKVRVGKLDTFEDLFQEAARIYKAARQTVGKTIDDQSGKRLIDMLLAIRQMKHSDQLERRLDGLEGRDNVVPFRKRA